MIIIFIPSNDSSHNTEYQDRILLTHNEFAQLLALKKPSKFVAQGSEITNNGVSKQRKFKQNYIPTLGEPIPSCRASITFP